MNDAAAAPADLAALRAAAANGSVPVERPYFLFAPAGSPGAAEARRLADWLRLLPCPTLCVPGRDPSRSLVRAADVVLRSAEDAEPLLANIRRHPVAASVLVQLLRVTEKLPVHDALLAESLAYATLQSGAEYRRWLDANRGTFPKSPKDPGPAVEIVRNGAELRIELNRPSNRNAISVEMRDALVEAFQLALADDTIKKLRLTGRGKCFSVGGDLAEFGSVPDPAAGHLIRMQTLPARFLARCAERAEASVHSACIGAGIELPAFARRVTAAPDAFFQLPELAMGLIPGAGGTVSVSRRIGRQRAAWLMLSGRRLGVKKALEWGLIDSIADRSLP